MQRLARLLCRARSHPLDGGDVIQMCPCSARWFIHIDSPEDLAVMRIRAANTNDPGVAAALTAVADWIEEDARD